MLHIEAAQPAPNAVAQIAREIVRTEMERIIRDACDASVATDEQLDRAEQRLETLKDEINRKAFASALPAALAAAERLGLACPAPLEPSDARTISVTLKKLCEIEVKVHDEGEDPLEAGLALLDRHALRPLEGNLPPVLRLSDGIAAAVTGKTAETAKKIRTTGDLAIEFLGDVPLEQLAQRASELLLLISRLPKLHGKTHGNNRYKKDRPALSKWDEIALADLEDEKVYEELRSNADLTDAERRVRATESLTRRTTDTNLQRHLDRLHDIMRAAAKLGYTGSTKLMTYRELDEVITVAVEQRRRQNPLYVRVTQPKLRLRWAGERIRTLLTSPIYRGCFSKSRRTRPGRLIFRDALYWVPLLELTMGTRITEVLQLRKDDVILRDHTWCLRLCWAPDQTGKTDSSTRIVPLSQVVLELGFVEWVKNLGETSSTLLFPEIVSANPATPAQIFTKRMNTVRKNLGIADHHEDLYALRKTLSSALWKGGVSTDDRQMIIGHVSDTTIGKHYTEADMATLKALLDRADHRIVVTAKTHHRFPVIGECTLVSGVLARVEVVLDSEGHLGAVRIVRERDNRQLIALAIRKADLPAAPAWRGMETVRRAIAPDRVADLLSEHHLIPPGNSEHRAAFEHFLAMAAHADDAPSTSSGATLRVAA